MVTAGTVATLTMERLGAVRGQRTRKGQGLFRSFLVLLLLGAGVAVSGTGSAQPGAQTMAADVNDGEHTENGSLINADAAAIKVGVGGEPFGNGRNVFINFQLPELGIVANPFTSASLTVNLETVTNFDGFNFNVDLYAFPPRPGLDRPVLGTLVYYESNPPDPNSDMTLLQDDFITGGHLAVPGPYSTSSGGSTNLRDYLNQRYAGGAGIGEFVFLRLNPDADNGAVLESYNLNSANALSAANRPTITYTAGLTPPVARAGADQFVNPGTRVTLDGSASSDPDGDPLSFSWEQVGGPFVPTNPSGFTTANPSFTLGTPAHLLSGAPPIVATFTFRLTVTDPSGASDADEVHVTVLEDVDHAVFVSSTLGDDADAGTRERPVKTLSRARQIAGRTTPGSDIYVHEGLYPTSATLTVPNGMSLYGGFDAFSDPSLPSSGAPSEVRGWTRTAGNPTHIQGPAIAVQVVGPITNPTAIDGLTIESADGSFSKLSPGRGNSVAIYVRDAGQRLRITNNRILAGEGAPGTSGLDGMPGLDGRRGGLGQNAFPGITDPGVPGISPCGAHGGLGGFALSFPIDWGAFFTLSFDGQQGTLTDPLGGGEGGAAGGRTFFGSIIPAEDGRDGLFSFFSVFAGGAGGSGGAFDPVRLWASDPGDDGFARLAGNGGGGGGAGSGGQGTAGGAGGGGGGGGCPGSGGQGGFGGGGSFGILLGEASPVIARNTISTGGGGRGGDGGTGGNGGRPGLGGLGGLGASVFGFGIGRGGDGGHGGGGGSGGGGGGGAGGPSCGVLKAEGSEPTLAGNHFSVIGPAGKGGTGGEDGLRYRVVEDRTFVSVSSPRTATDGHGGARGDVCPRFLRPALTQALTVEESSTSSLSVTVSASLSAATFVSTWTGSDVVATLETPSSRIIDRDTTASDVAHVLGPDFEEYRIRNPEAGTWTVQLFGADVPPAGESVTVTVTEIPANQLPIADAGVGLTVECRNAAGTTVALDASASIDPDGDILSFEWRDAAGGLVGTSSRVDVTLQLGSHTFTLTVHDGRSGTGTDAVEVTVEDTTSPIVSISNPLVIPIPNAAGGAFIDPGTASASDQCDLTLTTTHDAPSVFPFGVTTVTWTSTDDSGNSGSATQVVVVPTPTEALRVLIGELQEIVGNNPGTPLADKVEDALAKSATALNEFTRLPPDNQAGVGAIEGAVGDLVTAVDDNELDSNLGLGLMDGLATIARQIAQAALDTATACDPNNPDLEEARQSLNAGDALRASGMSGTYADFKDAVNAYKDALSKAEGILSEC